MITSRRNPMVQQARAVAAGAKAAPAGLCFVEGVRLVEEWLSSGLEADSIFASERLDSTPRGQQLLQKLQADACGVTLVADEVLDSISNVRQSQGVAVVIHRPQHTVAGLLGADRPLIAVAAGLQDPGNLGTMVRTAHAVGAHGAVATAGTVSPFNAKSIRASAGSMLHLPVAADADFAEFAQAAREKGVMLIACSPEAPTSYLDSDLTGGVALVFGQEGSGLAPELAGKCDLTVRIPTDPAVESLNVASSAAVLLYEAARQRA